MKTRYFKILQQQSMVKSVCFFPFSRALADVFLQRLNHKERLQLAPRNTHTHATSHPRHSRSRTPSHVMFFCCFFSLNFLQAGLLYFSLKYFFLNLTSRFFIFQVKKLFSIYMLKILIIMR